MSTKTTLALAFSLVVLVLLYYVVRSGPGAAETRISPLPAVASSPTTRDLLETKLGDIVKVVCRGRDREEWVFQKDTESSGAGQPVWRMTAPLEMKCLRWEVDKFGSRLGNLKYELSYRTGEPGALTAAGAGLNPPEAVITLTDADGKTVTVEIGKAASSSETYVRLAGSDEIFVGKSRLRDLVKDKALEYREKQLWDFDAQDVTRVEIDDRSDADSPVSYAFARDGSRWMMESPVTARATSKLDDVLSGMARLRALQWHDDRQEKLGMYGLDPAALVVRVTVEEQVPVEKDEDEDESGEGEGTSEGEEGADESTETETKTTVYELHVSDRSPIGEDTMTYMRIGRENSVATVMKSAVAKFKPVMSEWREMRITTVDTGAATRIELATPDGSATIVKKEGQWSFQSDGGGAEASVVSELLKAVGGLEAVTFIDGPTPDLAAFGLDKPQAEIRLTIPGVEGVERVTVGGYTDEAAKRLLYARRNELTSIGKVRRADVAKLLRGPHLYRDRTIVDVPPSRFERIVLSTENRFDAGAGEVTLQRIENTWTMSEPVKAEVREDQMDKLIEALSGLRAEQVVADEGEASAYGLHAPAVTVALTYKPPTEFPVEPPADEASDTSETGEEEGGEDKAEATVPEEVQPPSKTLELSVAEHDGKYYARRSDRGTIYEVTRGLFNELLAEYRTDRIMDFDDTKVRALSIRKGDKTHVFTRHEGRWLYQAEPDLPLDSKKVDDLVRQIRDLRTRRYVRHATDDLAGYGLSAPLHEVTVTLDDNASHTLWISEQVAVKGPDRGSYAAVKNASGVFLLSAASLRRLEVSLDELEEAR